MTDNGGQFVAARFRDALRVAGVRHIRIRPGHPWTNGKTERVFRTVKELQRFYAPVLVSFAHVRSFCADVIDYYNHCRPHSAHWGLTPDERLRQALAARSPSAGLLRGPAARLPLHVAAEGRSLTLWLAGNDVSRVPVFRLEGFAEPNLAPESAAKRLFAFARSLQPAPSMRSSPLAAGPAAPRRAELIAVTSRREPVRESISRIQTSAP